MFKDYMADIKMDGLNNVAWTVGGVSALSFSMLIILRQLPSIAASLAGGAALSFERGRRLDNKVDQGGKIISSAGSALIKPFRGSSHANSSPSYPAQAQGRQPQTLSRLASYGYYKGGARNATHSG
jgi:hypothetical protein